MKEGAGARGKQAGEHRGGGEIKTIGGGRLSE